MVSECPAIQVESGMLCYPAPSVGGASLLSVSSWSLVSHWPAPDSSSRKAIPPELTGNIWHLPLSIYLLPPQPRSGTWLLLLFKVSLLPLWPSASRIINLVVRQKSSWDLPYLLPASHSFTFQTL